MDSLMDGVKRSDGNCTFWLMWVRYQIEYKFLYCDWLVINHSDWWSIIVIGNMSQLLVINYHGLVINLHGNQLKMNSGLWPLNSPGELIKMVSFPAMHDIDGSVQERCNSSALAMELHLSCINLSSYKHLYTYKWWSIFLFPWSWKVNSDVI